MYLPVIGVTGPARTGKDTLANFIIAARGGYRYAFADPLKSMLLPLGIDMRASWWIERKEEPIAAFGNKSPRYLMQTIGTEWGRKLVSPDLWVMLAQQRLLEIGQGMVLSDLRFENEATWVRRMGGKVIHVRRSAAPKVNAHSSEDGVAVHSEDIVFENNGTVADLQKQVLHVFQTGEPIRPLGALAPT